MHADLDAVDRTLLDLVQAGVPLVPRPFARLAQALGADEAEVLTRLRRLAEARVLRQIGAIFDTRACGYASALVAARVVGPRHDFGRRALLPPPWLLNLALLAAVCVGVSLLALWLRPVRLGQWRFRVEQIDVAHVDLICHGTS